MKEKLKKISFLYKNIQKIRKIKNYFLILKKRSDFRVLLKNQESIKLVIGASGVFDKDWIPSEQEYLDLLKEKDWKKYFPKNSITCILTEHVWEHLSMGDGLVAAKNCYTYMKNGGNLRIAVPDGYHPHKEYIDKVKVGIDGHQVLYTYKSLMNIFIEAGFKVELLEYFDENKIFHQKKWNIKYGKIHRSLEFDERNKIKKMSYTSIILDAKKYE